MHPLHAGPSPRSCEPNASEPFVDAETGFTYLRARYYDPATGQFISRDPIEAITQSPYAYVDGSPLNGTDPTGLYPGEGAVKAAKNAVVKVAVNAVRYSPPGIALDFYARVTGHSVGVCAGGNVTFVVSDRSASACYVATPSGEAGFTFTYGRGTGVPSANYGIGPMVSNARTLDDLRGPFVYGYGNLGTGGLSAQAGFNRCDDLIWSIGGSYGRGVSAAGPVSGGGGMNNTWASGSGGGNSCGCLS